MVTKKVLQCNPSILLRLKPKVLAFMEKVECKKYPKAVWNSMSKQQMQVRNCMDKKALSLP